MLKSENVSKNFNTQSTNINNWNVFTPAIQEMIPIEKFPKKDKTTSIFKCQIPPKKSPKHIITPGRAPNSHQEKMS